MKMTMFSFAVLLLGTVLPRRFFFAAPDDKGGPETQRVRPPAKPTPAPVVTGTSDEQADRQKRLSNSVHRQRLETLNRDRAANGMPPVDEVPGFFQTAADQVEPDFTPPLTGFAAQGAGRPVGTGGELGTSNERAAVGKVPVGSSDVAVAETERSVAQDQPIEGGAGTVPSGEIQASAPIVDPVTGKAVGGSEDGKLVATGESKPAGPAGEKENGRHPGESDEDFETRRQNTPLTDEEEDAAEDLVQANTREQLVDLAAKEGVEVGGNDDKKTIAEEIVRHRRK